MHKLVAFLVAASALAALPGCAVSEKDKSDKEWSRAECNRVIDAEARERCLKQL